MVFTARCVPIARRILCCRKMSFCLSFCPSVRLEHAGIVSKRLNIIIKLFSLRAKPYRNTPTGTPLTEASNARGMKKLRSLTTISLYLRNNTIDGRSYCGSIVGALYDLSNDFIFRMMLNDLEWLSEIFNDTKHLRQLSFLLFIVCLFSCYFLNVYTL